MILIVIFGGLIAGLIIGFSTGLAYPSEYTFYITVALLAALDSLVGAARAQLQKEFNGVVFTTGLIVNTILAALLTYLGDLLGVPIYYAAIITFGGRLFNNMAVIRRVLLDRYVLKKSE
ncbi:MAG: small basic family protein [Firmicutes bacterium]|nr:small basic family protein [Bacillota bacterium]